MKNSFSVTSASPSRTPIRSKNKFYYKHKNLFIRVIFKQLPKILIVHLKRFKYDEQYRRLVKLNWKIAFSFDIKLKSLEC